MDGWRGFTWETSVNVSTNRNRITALANNALYDVANGRWVNIPPYGMVWQPTTVAVGWAPYRHGHWAWVEPWGWTWVDSDPWGFENFIVVTVPDATVSFFMSYTPARE